MHVILPGSQVNTTILCTFDIVGPQTRDSSLVDPCIKYDVMYNVQYMALHLVPWSDALFSGSISSSTWRKALLVAGQFNSCKHLYSYYALPQ